MQRNHRFSAQNDRAFHCVPQLANIPRPIVTLQQLDRPRRDPPNALVDLLGVVCRKPMREGWNVVLSFAQRRQTNSDDAQSTVEVLPEMPSGRVAREIA